MCLCASGAVNATRNTHSAHQSDKRSFCGLRATGSVRTARMVWWVTSAYLHLAAATGRIGSRFTLHNFVSSADRVLATHRGCGYDSRI